MIFLFIAAAFVLPQEYVNIVLNGQYDEARLYCEEKINSTGSADWQIQLGDLYFYKLDDLNKAEEIYRGVLETGKQKDGSVHLRMAQILELKEDYLNAAREYEIVATRYRTPPLDSFALTGVERCFKKNYQDYVATVDGFHFTRLELDERVSNAGPFGNKNEKAVLDQMILERLLYTSALKNNVKETVAFRLALTDQKRALLLEETRAVDIVARAKPTDPEMRRYYKKNKENYRLKEEIRGKEIIVESESLANFIRDTLAVDTACFDSLAKLHSVAPSRSGGGFFTIINRGTKSEAVEDILFKMKTRTVSAVIPADGKFGVYIVTEHKPDRYRTFDEVKSQVEMNLQAENQTALEEKLKNRLLKEYSVVVYKDSMVLTDTNTAVAQINGRVLRRRAVEERNKKPPNFGATDLNNLQAYEDLVNLMIVEEMKIEWAEKHRYYINDGYFIRLVDNIHKNLDQGLYNKIVVEPVTVDSSEVIARYLEHREEMKIVESVMCLEIVLYSRAEAEKVRQELATGYGAKSCLLPFLSKPARVADIAFFDSLARIYSVASSKDRGGETGLLRRGMREKEFEDAAFKLKPGSLSGVIRVGDSSYTIIAVIEHTPTTYRTIEEVWPTLDAGVKRDKQRKIVEEFLAKIKAEADIKITLPEPVVTDSLPDSTGVLPPEEPPESEPKE